MIFSNWKPLKIIPPSELMTIIIFLEGGMFCDRFGQEYTREHIKKIAEILRKDVLQND